MVGHPRRFAGEMAFDRFVRPLVEHLDVGARALRLQAQRIADEIGLRLALVQRQVELPRNACSRSAASSDCAYSSEKGFVISLLTRIRSDKAIDEETTC